LDDPFDSSAVWGQRVVETLLNKGAWGGDAYQLFYNVNFPPCSAEATKGVQITTQGRREGVFFGCEPHIAPTGRRYIWLRGGNQHVATAPGTDNQANLDNYVSVTPMRCDLTAYDTLDALKGVFE